MGDHFRMDIRTLQLGAKSYTLHKIVVETHSEVVGKTYLNEAVIILPKVKPDHKNKNIERTKELIFLI
jgi:hypothetical protein